MRPFHVYLVRDRIDGPITRAFVTRNRSRDLEPDNNCPGAVDYQPLEARDYGDAKRIAFSLAPAVFEADGRAVRRRGV